MRPTHSRLRFVTRARKKFSAVPMQTKKIIGPKIQKLLKVSRTVIQDCALENGAIVAANSDKPYFPKEAYDYRYVWIRDASFVCVAADILQIPIQEPFFSWLYKNPEDFDWDHLLYANYSTNGRVATMGKLFMADQTGTLLWAIYLHYQRNLKKALQYKDLVKRLADGLSVTWNKQFFSVTTADIWEELGRKTSIRMQNNFTYSLAACARGLLLANEIMPNLQWKQAAMEMIDQINEAYNKQEKRFYRNVGRLADPNIDASLLGLVWPFSIFEAKDEKIINTVKKMEELIVISGGVHRYQFDYFDSEGSAQEGGGAWPVLNFWMTIYWVLAGNKKKALTYYHWVVDRADKFGGFLPEQFFPDFRVGIYPLAWSHAMFVIASHYLGYI